MNHDEGTELKRSIYEGVFSHMFATLTGGMFLTGFAIYLGMDEFTIGLMASMPFLATILQLPASHLMGRNGGRRKKFWFWGAAVARAAWIPILIIALVPTSSISPRSRIVLWLILLSYGAISVSHVSWLSLMSDMVPERIRGRFFGTRNMLCGLAGIGVMLVFGNSLDYLKDHVDGMLPLGFAFVFASAILSGILSLRLIKKIPDPHRENCHNHLSFYKNLGGPLKEANFRRFLTYGFSWSFSVHFAAPFITLYLFTDLQFSYGFVAVLGMISAMADLIGMRLWGRIADKVKNKAIMQFGSTFAVLIPFLWIIVRPGDVLLPVFINLVGGGFWAGINLCTNNLLLGVSPRDNRASYLSVYNAAAGLGAAGGPVVAGILLKYFGRADLTLFSHHVQPLHVIFLMSAIMRALSFRYLRNVRESEEVKMGRLVRVLADIRGLNVASGFNYLLHPFVGFDLNDNEDDNLASGAKDQNVLRRSGAI